MNDRDKEGHKQVEKSTNGVEVSAAIADVSQQLPKENSQGHASLPTSLPPIAESPTNGRVNHDTGGRFTMGNTASVTHGQRSSRFAAGLFPEAEALAALTERRAEIERDLGGGEQLSTLARDLVGRYVELSLIADYLVDNVARLGPLTAKGRSRAAVSAYLQVVDRQAKIAERLGLERRAKRVPSLREFMSEPVGASTNGDPLQPVDGEEKPPIVAAE